MWLNVLKLGLILLVSASNVSGRCSVHEIHVATRTCLTRHLVDPETDPLVPVLNNSAAVVNFCLFFALRTRYLKWDVNNVGTLECAFHEEWEPIHVDVIRNLINSIRSRRHISDIKTCYVNVISACISDKRVEVLFGSTGAALLSAFTGICSEPQKDHDMTCASENYMANISASVQLFIKSVDSMDLQNTAFAGFCAPLHELHSHIMDIMDAAVETGDCSDHSRNVIHQYMSTVVFPCTDIATSYYPCTLAKLNTDAMECYSKNGVIVGNALIPTPRSLSNVDDMCSYRGSILKCIKGLITQCLYEPQVTTLYGSAVEGFEASFECMCSPDNFDMILTCAATADVTSPMTIFTSSVHNLTVEGTLTRSKQCSLEQTLVNSIESKLARTCTKTNMKRHWRAYLSTVIYPCTEISTQCYPRNHYNGAGNNNHVSLAALIFSLVSVLELYRPVYGNHEVNM